MNRLYRHVWSKSLGRVIVVAECMPGGGGKKSSRRRKLATALMASTLLSSAAWADNLPAGGQVVAGQATIATSGNAVTVNQSTDRMIANWQSFSIGSGNSVTFNQPGASSVALNRVTGQDPSQILGSLNANGQVFLLNPNGIAIGKTGSVQTGGFVASTLGMSNSDFLNGNYQFNGTGGSITNDGSLNGHVVALIAPRVTNNGTITGDAALAAGTDVLLDFNGDGLLSVEVKANTLAGLVENNGLISATNGTAILTAKGASAALKGVVNNTGTVEAKRIGRKNGRILLLGDMDSGEVSASGTLKADFVETSAAKVIVDDNFRAETNGGTWLIDPNDYTIAASGGDITGATLSANLLGGSIIIQSANGGTAGNGDIFVNDTVTWAANTLTLNAIRNIEINSAMNASGTAGLVLQYGQGAVAASNTAIYSINAPVNLASTGNFSTKLGSDGTTVTYTIITSLGAAGSTTSTDLQGMSGGLAGNYVLGSNIDASGTSTWNSGAGFAPIGDNSTNFTGKFDGLGHTITGLTINRTTDYVGLFGDTNGASIKNIGMIGGSVTGRIYAGGLVGENSGSTITNAYATGSVSGTDSVGGLVGSNDTGSSITNSYASGIVTGDWYVGGLVGWNQDSSSITDAHATGSVSGDYHVGGLVGGNYTGSSITNSYATGSVSGNESVGGLVGRNYNTGSSITNAYASGIVTSPGDYVGGLVGWNHDNSSITDAHATGSVSGDDYVGGLVGYNDTTITNAYATGNVSAIKAYVGGLAGYAYESSIISNAYATGSVTGFEYVGGLVGHNNKSGGITNVYATGNVTGDWYVGGLLGDNHLSTVSNAYATGSVAGFSGYVGGLVGFNLSGTISNAYATGSVTGGQLVGGLVGGNDTSSITNAYATGRVTTNLNGGGLVGRSVRSTITNSFYNSQTTGQGDDGTGATKTTAEMTTKSTFTDAGWDLSTIWGIKTSENSGYPILRALNTGINFNTALTITLGGTTKIYGDANPTLGSFSLSGCISCITGIDWDALITAGTDVGTYAYSDSVLNYTWGGGFNASDFDISFVGNTGLIVTPRVLDLTGTRTYDGGVALANSIFTLNNLYNGETLSLSGSGSMTTKNVGTGKAVTLSSLALGNGTGSASNYTLTGGTHTATIGTAALTVTANNASKTYDGQAFTGGNGVVYSGFVNSETATVLGGTIAFDGTAQGAINAGGYTLTASGLTSGNYTISYTDGALTVNKAALTLSGLAIANKTYDGTVAAQINTIGTLAGIVSGDTVSADIANASASFVDRNAGTGKVVTVNGIILSGASAGNYVINGTASATADIERAVISAITGITANNKTFDGTTAAALNTAGSGFTGMIAGDILNIASSTGAFINADVESNKTVNITGLTLGGFDAGNYTLFDTTAVATADITNPVDGSSCSSSGTGNLAMCGMILAPTDQGSLVGESVQIEIVQTAQAETATTAKIGTGSVDEEGTTPAHCRSKEGDSNGEEEGAAQACSSETQTQ